MSGVPATPPHRDAQSSTATGTACPHSWAWPGPVGHSRPGWAQQAGYVRPGSAHQVGPRTLGQAQNSGPGRAQQIRPGCSVRSCKVELPEDCSRSCVPALSSQTMTAVEHHGCIPTCGTNRRNHADGPYCVSQHLCSHFLTQVFPAHQLCFCSNTGLRSWSDFHRCLPEELSTKSE